MNVHNFFEDVMHEAGGGALPIINGGAMVAFLTRNSRMLRLPLNRYTGNRILCLASQVSLARCVLR